MPEEEEEVAEETSFEELAKRAEESDDDDDDDTVIDLQPDDKGADGLVERVVPIQTNEFTCRSCFLVKHRSQLSDKKRVLCVDCA